MPDPMFPRGAEWRRWDLQVHTPFSALNNGFGADFDAYATQLFQKAIRHEIAVVGITDYFSLEGYKRIKTIQSDGHRLAGLLGNDAQAARRVRILPNIELRSSVIITRQGRDDSRVNFHVLFSDEIPVNILEENFLKELKFTAESDPDNPDERWLLTHQNLENFGARLKQQHQPFQNRSDLYIGMMNAVVSHGEVTEVLTRQASRFKNKYLLATPIDEDLSACNWNGQGHATRKSFIQKSHMLFSSNPNTRLFGLGEKHATADEYLAEFKTLKPCVHGSDAHTYQELFEPDDDRQLWVKADPTFEGLRQLLHEPADRAYIGVLPPSLERLRAHPTKVIESLAVRRSPAARTNEKWFDCNIPLNSELVAVIGNKGSGKSALADILGLLGNTPQHESFAFLNGERFRSAKGSKARDFEASLTWRDGTPNGPISLDADPPNQAVETVKYVPQNYLEEICNEVGLGADSRFYSELQKVIFSHVPDAERQGFQNLESLLAHRGEEVNKGIKGLVAELSGLNATIIGIEERLTHRHKSSLELQLAEKIRELAAHVVAKPKERTKPEEDAAAQEHSRVRTAELELKQAALAGVEAAIVELQAEDGRLAKRRLSAERLVTKFRNLQRQIEVVTNESAADFVEVGVAAADVLSVTINTEPLNAAIATIDNRRTEISSGLDTEKKGAYPDQRRSLKEEAEKIQESLTAPQREYQEYLAALKAWQLGERELIGADDLPGTVRYLERSIAGLADLPAALRNAVKRRDAKAVEILREKHRLHNYYKDYYGAVQSFLDRHPLATGDAFRVTFTVAMAQTGLVDGFLGKINQRKNGHFSGLDEGQNAIRHLVETVNFESQGSVLRFVRRLIGRLHRDGDTDYEVQDQLVQGETTQSIYDYLFSFEYLSPIYRLTWDEKGLEQLSPGERGNLLLIFYLLIDREDIPLVIDQPEENLDNQTVVKTLVPCIKDAKRRRQIVMVTHNPNLAVVCDAEQVIYAEIRKEDQNQVRYISGSIEDGAVNQRILDVLEGTRPAFDKRDERYLPV